MRKCAVWTIPSYSYYNWKNASSNVFCVLFTRAFALFQILSRIKRSFTVCFCWVFVGPALKTQPFFRKKWDKNLVKFALFTCFADLRIFANAQFSNFLRSKNWSMAREVGLLTFLQHRNLITREQTFVYNTSLFGRIYFFSSAGNFQFYFCFARKNDWIAK